MSHYTPFPGPVNPPAGPPGGGMPGGFDPTLGSSPFGAPPDPVPAAEGRRARVKPAKAPKAPKAPKEKAPREGKAVTKRAISRNAVLAAFFAVLAGGLVVFLLSDTEPAQTYVARTTSDIAAGTSISGALIEAAPLPEAAIEPGTFTAPTGEEAIELALAELEGVVTQYPLGAKVQLRADQFGLQTSLGADLAPTDRLVSIRATVSTAVAGGLTVGDHVDIIGADDGRTAVVAYNVPIMSITVSEDLYNSVADQQTADREVRADEVLPGQPVPGIYVVKVPADLVLSLVNWNESAVLYLSYRGPDAVDVASEDHYLTDPTAAVPNEPFLDGSQAEEPFLDGSQVEEPFLDGQTPDEPAPETSPTP